MAYGGSEEGYQLFGPQAMPDKNQQFLDQTSRMQDQNRDDSRWLAEEQLANTRTAGAGIQHGIDQGFSQYNIGNQRADLNQQRGIDNARAADTQGMEHTRLGMDQATRALTDQGYANLNAQSKITLDNATREQAFQNGIDPATGKSRYESHESGKYDDDMADYGPNGRHAQTFAMDMSKGRSEIGMNNANAGALAEGRARDKTLFSQGQDKYAVDQLAANIISARQKGDAKAEEQYAVDARNKGMAPADISKATTTAASTLRSNQVTADVVARTKPGNQDALGAAHDVREQLAHLSNLTQQAHDYQQAKPGTPQEATARVNYVDNLRRAGKNQEADFIEDGGKNSLRIPGGASVNVNGFQREGDRVQATLKSMRTEVKAKIEHLKGLARGSDSPTVVQEVNDLERSLAQIEGQADANHTGDQEPRLVGGKGLSNASMFQPPEQLPGAQGAVMPQQGALPISFQGGQPNAYGRPAARPSVRPGGQ